MRRLVLAAVAVAFAAGLTPGCSSEPPPPVCADLAGTTDVLTITDIVGNYAPGFDYSSNAIAVEQDVRSGCPDELFKLERWRSEVLGG